MAAATVVIGYGALFQRGDGAGPEVFTSIVEIRDISGPGLSRPPVDVTHNTSPNAWREFLAGLSDGGEVTIEGNWCPGQSSQTTPLISDFDNQDRHNFKIVLPDAGDAEFAFSGFVTKFDPKTPMAEGMNFSATFKVSGKPTFTP